MATADRIIPPARCCKPNTTFGGGITQNDTITEDINIQRGGMIPYNDIQEEFSKVNPISAGKFVNE
jgi:hypothetical protein